MKLDSRTSDVGGGDRLAIFIGGKALEPFIDAELRSVIDNKQSELHNKDTDPSQ